MGKEILTQNAKSSAKFIKRCEREACKNDTEYAREQRECAVFIAQLAAEDAKELKKKPTAPRTVKVAPTVAPRSNARAHNSQRRATQTDGTGGDSSDPDSSDPAKPIGRATARPFDLQIHANQTAQSQRATIIKYLFDGGQATQKQFWEMFGICIASARIAELRKFGYQIRSLRIDPENPQTVTYALDLENPFIAPEEPTEQAAPNSLFLPFDDLDNLVRSIAGAALGFADELVREAVRR